MKYYHVALIFFLIGVILVLSAELIGDNKSNLIVNQPAKLVITTLEGDTINVSNKIDTLKLRSVNKICE